MWSPTVFASTSMKCFVGAAAQAYFDMTQYVGGVNANTNLYFRSISSGTYTYPLTLSTSRVGINTINPLYTLDVTGQSRIQNDRGVLILQGAQDSNSLYTTFQKSTLTSYIGWFGFGLQGAPYSNYFGMQSPASTNIAFYPGGAAAASPPLFLGSNSRVGILTTTPQATLDVTGNIYASGSITGNSDKRVKQDIMSANTSICYSTMKGIDLKYFQWDPLFQSTCLIQDNHQLGFIAQDIEHVFPNSIFLRSTFGYDDFQSIETGQINAMHYGATQELMSLVEQTMQRVNQLETLQQQSASTIAGLQQQLGSA